jgi:DNA-binding NtrC family response regulator
MVEDLKLRASATSFDAPHHIIPEHVMPLLIGSTVEEIERELILQTLASCEGNRTRAARILGMSIRTLRYKIRQYSDTGIDVPAHH